MRRLFFLILLGVFGAYLFRTYIGGYIRVASPSMEPTLKKNSIIWMNTGYYRNHPIQRGDIIVFKSPVDEKQLIKRVIAIGGDTIEIKYKKVYLNWEELSEPYVYFEYPDKYFVGDFIPEMKVPEGCLFVLGDNRDRSEDSRYWKDAEGRHIYFIKEEDVVGKISKKW
ncbi:MAG: signal peptidase I [Elusimicrobia bacterium]|nr:signal peptidase I [Elusimicrobiota bacterium]